MFASSGHMQWCSVCRSVVQSITFLVAHIQAVYICLNKSLQISLRNAHFVFLPLYICVEIRSFEVEVED